jgi:hypothetical protein
MRRSTRARRSAVAGCLAPLALLLALSGCASGDAEDAEAIVGQEDSTPETTEAVTTDDSVTEAGTGTTAADELPISVFDLELGTCFDDPAFAAEESSTIGETTAVQCFDPHDAEVYAIVPYTQTDEDAYPGEEAVQDYADDQCFDRFEDFVGIPYEESALDIATIWPTEDSWSQGDREAVCSVFHVENQKLEGTMDSAEV